MVLEHETIVTPVVSLTVSSPDELAERISTLKSNRQIKSRYIALALTDKRVVSRAFDFPQCPLDELKKNIYIEAIDLLSIQLNDIEIDYHICSESEGRINGVFTCTPKAVVNEYLDVLDAARLIPIKLTDAFLVGIDSFLLKFKKQEGRFCLLDFSQQNIIYCSIMRGKKGEFLRRVFYETIHEAKRAVIQTLQGFCARSEIKKIDHVFIVGEVPDIAVLIREIKETFDATIHQEGLTMSGALTSFRSLFRINLLRRYVFSLKERNLIILASYLIVLTLLAESIFSAIDIKNAEVELGNLRSSFDSEGYHHAQQLVEQLQ